MKTSNMLAAAMALIVPSVICLSGCSAGMFTFFNYKYENADRYTAGDREIEDKITTINIDYVSGDVKLKGTADSTVKVTETSNKALTEEQKVHTWVDGSTLYIRYCASIDKISFCKIEKDLEITMPEVRDLDSIIVHVSSGNMIFTDFKADKLNAESSSGNIDIDGSVSDAVIKSSSGNTKLALDGDSDSIDIRSSSGTVDLSQNGNAGSVKVNSSSGGVRMLLDKATDVDIHVSSGSINVEGNEIINLKSHASSGSNSFRIGKAPRTSDIHSSSGSVKVYIPADSDITIKPHISSGDFNYDLALTKNGKEYINGNGSSEMIINVSSGDVDILNY